MASTVVKAAYWLGDAGLPAANIDSTLFTHLFCAFADVNPQTYEVTIAIENHGPFSTFNQTVQERNPGVKTLLSIGGGNATPATFAAMASSAKTRTAFIDSSIRLARSSNFLGLDLDWEYPQTEDEMKNLGSLLNEWRKAVQIESGSTNNAPLLLTAATYSSSSHEGLLYPIQAISDSLDWINLMAYDFYAPGWSRDVAGPPAALYNTGDRDPLACGDVGVQAWIDEGVPAQKLVLGLPFYGYAWELEDPNSNGLFALANGAANGAGIDPTDGSIDYNKIVNFKNGSGATGFFDASFVTDYCHSGTTWIGYDDTKSITNKVEYAVGKKLFGYFAWHVGGDRDWTLSRTGKYIVYI
jgi:chitinase